MLLDELAAYLETQALGTVGTDLFKGLLPDTPDACVALFETPGGPPGLTDSIDLRSFQVRTRAAGYSDARQKCEDIFALLHGLHEQTLSGARYVLVAAKQAPFSLGRDDRQRHEFAANFRALRDSPDR